MYVYIIHTYICGRKALEKTVTAGVYVSSNVHVHVYLYRPRQGRRCSH
jgi:hypothetical protein